MPNSTERARDFLPTGFPGYRLQSLKPTTEVFEHELADFAAGLPGALDFIRAHSPWAAKLRREGDVAEAFSSAAYPECPGIVFYTELIRFHLPPSQIWGPGRAWGSYPVLENLVHESVHHWWGRECTRFAELAPLLQNEIRVSWREQAWSVDKALHAGMVYLAATELRWMYAPEEVEVARRAAAEIFAALPPGEWNVGARATLESPGAGRFLERLGIK